MKYKIIKQPDEPVVKNITVSEAVYMYLNEGKIIAYRTEGFIAILGRVGGSFMFLPINRNKSARFVSGKIPTTIGLALSQPFEHELMVVDNLNEI